MAKLIRYNVMEEEHIGDNVFKVHRPYPFGNPYVVDKQSKFKDVIKVKTLDECLDLYSKYFDNAIVEIPAVKTEWERLIKAYDTFDVVYIGCYCHLDKKCHGDVIIKKVKQYALKRALQNMMKENGRKNDN